MQMTENKEQRPVPVARFPVFFAAAKDSRAPEMSAWNSRALFREFGAENSRASCETPRMSPKFSPRVILSFDSAPVDITVDKQAHHACEKAQQNQHFKYHSAVRYSYRAVKKPLTALPQPTAAPPRHLPSIVTLLCNMHRSGAACSLNVTSIGICLSRQHLRIYRNRAFFVPESTAAVDSPGMRDYSENDLWNARWPTSQGFFPGNS